MDDSIPLETYYEKDIGYVSLIPKNENNEDTRPLKDIVSYIEKDEEHNNIVDGKSNNIVIIENENNTNNNPTKLKSKVRQSNFELLRIIAMLMIITFHLGYHGNLVYDVDKVTPNRLWAHFISFGGKTGVDMYVLISGYFLINSKNVKINKLIKMELQMITYSVMEFFLGVFFKTQKYTVKDLKHSMLPVTYDFWWFASTYIILYLFFPVINASVHSLEKVTYKNYLIVMTLLWCVIPTLFEIKVESYSRTIWFGYLYFFAAFIKKYSIGNNIKGIIWIILGILSYLFMFVFTVINAYRAINNENAVKYTVYLYFDDNKIPVLLTAIFIFLGFSKMKFSSRIINYISSTTFGVYLLHDGPSMRPLLWKVIFKIQNHKDDSYLILYTITSVLVVFTVCSIIEIIRVNTIEKLYMKFVDYITLKIEKLIKKIN